ncbi:MAG: outer membrane protein assembly factor BamD [Rikenellaceae bacterium]
MKITHKLLLVICSAVAFSACGPFNFIAKSGDSEMIYHSAFDYYDEGKYSKALELFNLAAPYFIGSPRADTIAFYAGTCSYKSGDFDASSMAFDNFRRTYPRSPFVEDAEYMYAKGFYYASPDVQKDQSWTNMAIYNINEYLYRYPNSIKKDVLLENIKELELKLKEKSYLSAYTYFKIGRYKSAIKAFENALGEYPDSPFREQILYYTAKAGYLLAKDSYSELQRDRYLNVLDYYYNFVAEFPESKYKRELARYEGYSQDFLKQFEKKGQNAEKKSKK